MSERQDMHEGKTSLTEQLEAARAEVERLERAAAQASCREVGHDWKHIGGRNCGCGDWANCSVPVYGCKKCGDCDYGDNEEARQKIAECEDRHLPDFEEVIAARESPHP